VEIGLHRSEPLVELDEQLDDRLYIGRAVPAAALHVGFLVFLAEDPQLRECLRALVVCRKHSLEPGEFSKLHEQTPGQLRAVGLPGEQDLVQDFLCREKLTLADPVEQSEHVLFLRMRDVLLYSLQRDLGIGTEKQRKPLAFHAQVARVVFHHVQDVFRRLGGDRVLPLPEEARHPALLLVVEHLPEHLLVVEGHGPRSLLLLVPRDFLVDVSREPRAQEEKRGILGRGSEVLDERGHVLRALHLFRIRDDDQPVPCKQGHVAQAADDLRHVGFPGVEPRALGRLPAAG